MGKGDKKTKRGKIIQGSFGITRPRKPKKVFVKGKSIVELAREEKVTAVNVKEDGLKPEEPVEVADSPAADTVAEAPKKKVTKSTKKPKTSAPELDLQVEDEPAAPGETPA